MRKTLLLFCFLVASLYLFPLHAWQGGIRAFPDSLRLGGRTIAKDTSVKSARGILKAKNDSVRALWKDLKSLRSKKNTDSLKLYSRKERRQLKYSLAARKLSAARLRDSLMSLSNPFTAKSATRGIADSISSLRHDEQFTARDSQLNNPVKSSLESSLKSKPQLSRDTSRTQGFDEKLKKITGRSVFNKNDNTDTTMRSTSGSVSLQDSLRNLKDGQLFSVKDRLSDIGNPDLTEQKDRVGKAFGAMLPDFPKPDSLAPGSKIEQMKDKGMQAGRDFRKKVEDSVLKKKKANAYGHGLGYNSIFLPGGGMNGDSYLAYVLSVQADVQIGKIPVNLELAQRHDSENGFAPLEMNLFNFRFDRPRFRSMFLSDEERLKNYRKSHLQGLSLTDYTSRSIQSKLRNMPEGKVLTDNTDFNSYIRNPANVNEMLRMDDFQLKEKLSWIASGKSGSGNSKNLKLNESDPKFTLKMKRSIDSVSAAIREVKRSMKAAGLDEDRMAIYQKYLSGREGIAQLDDEMLKGLSGKPGVSRIESYTSRVRDLRMGSFGTRVPGNPMGQEQMVQGFDVTVQSRRGPVRLGFGSQNETGMPKDMDFENASYSSPRYLSYLSVSTNNGSLSKGKLSWVGLFNRQVNNQSTELATLQRSSSALTITQSMDMKKLGALTVDLSKSASLYHNTVSAGAEDLYLQKNLISYYFSNQLLDNVSVGVNHSIDISAIGLSNTLYFNYADVGYQNAGAPALSQLKTRYGGSMKKQFFGNKLSLGARADIKHTPLTSSSHGAYWKSYAMQFDTRYRIGRKTNISLKYLNNGTDRMDTVNQRMLSSNKLQLSSNTSFKIAGRYTYSHIDIAGQQFKNSSELTGNSSLITLNYTQSTMMKGYTINGSLFYNKEISAFQLIGNMANAELGCQYVLLKKLSLNTAGTYLNSEGQARQAGIRQAIDFSPSSSVNISLAGDFRKNLIDPLYPMLYPRGRTEFSIKYYMKD